MYNAVICNVKRYHLSCNVKLDALDVKCLLQTLIKESAMVKRTKDDLERVLTDEIDSAKMVMTFRSGKVFVNQEKSCEDFFVFSFFPLSFSFFFWRMRIPRGHVFDLDANSDSCSMSPVAVTCCTRVLQATSACAGDGRPGNTEGESAAGRRNKDDMT